MGARGRNSKNELSVVSDQTIELVKRPPPPELLLPEQRLEWERIVGIMPADWFRPETYPLLVQRCRHVDTSNKVAQMIWDLESNADEFHIDKYDKLLRMQDRESARMVNLDTKLRLTLQSTRTAKDKKGDHSKKPWEL